jgi:molybdate transport system substrate-binding protein
MGQVTGISSMAMRHALAELADEYLRESGAAVSIETVGGVEAARRVAAGEPLDLVVLASEAIDQLRSAGRAGERFDLARSTVAVAVAAGAPHPDIASEAALRGAVLAARSIGYSTGPSGVHLEHLFERWGIAGEIAPRMVKAPPGVPVAALLARGDATLGFQQLSELIHEEGVEILGPLPSGSQVVTIFSGAVCAASVRPDAARAALAFFASREADAAKRRHGLQPA